VTQLARISTGTTHPTTDRRVHLLQWIKQALAPLLVLALMVAAWQTYVSMSHAPEYLVPGPGAVVQRFLEEPGYFYREGLVTTTEALLGLALGGSLAFVVGVALAYSRPLERSVLPWAIALKMTPIVAVAPMFTIWFGFGTLPKVLIAALITFFPVLINTIAGLRAVNAGALDVFRSLDASPLDVLLKLRIPSAMPYLFAALKVAITLSLIGAVVAEWSGSGRGLGRVILLAHANLDMPTLFAGVFVLASLGVVLTSIISIVERRLLFWHESFQGPQP
jgi:ABC-type nitrate/sulfonate/bicarbonate transport system permease component